MLEYPLHKTHCYDPWLVITPEQAKNRISECCNTYHKLQLERMFFYPVH